MIWLSMALLWTASATEVHRQAEILLGNNKLAEAAKLCRTALSIYQPGDLGSALLLRDLARIYRLEGYLNKAEAASRDSLGTVERVFGPEDANVAIGLNSLGEILFEEGRITDSRHALTRALDIAEKSMPAKSAHLATILHDLGAVYQMERRYPEAEFFYVRALKIRRANSEQAHVDATARNLATLYRLQNRRSDASRLERGLLPR